MNARPRIQSRARQKAAALLVAVVCLATPLASEGQHPARMYRIGFLAPGPPTGTTLDILRQGLREHGYVEGRSFAVEPRFAEGFTDRLPGLAAELAQLPVDVIVTVGGPAAEAAKQATPIVPVVFIAPGDPVGTGLVASLARPGANVTGFTDQSTELAAKRLQLLKEAVPSVSRVAVLWNSTDRAMTLRYRALESASRALDITMQPFGLREPRDFDGAFATMGRERPDALFVVTDSLTSLNRKRILDFAATIRLPTMYEFSGSVKDGALMSYGPSLPDMIRRAADYVDRILKGGKAGDLPVEQPTRFELVINLKTSKALGVTVPQSVLIRADEVVQ